MLKGLGVLFICISLTSPAFAKSIPDNLWKIVIAEAVGEGYQGMVAVSWVFRNRLDKGMSLGSSAVARKDLDEFVNKQSYKYRTWAKTIVQDVFSGKVKDPTGGATHFENVRRFGTPYWAKDMRITYRYRNHTFYK